MSKKALSIQDDQRTPGSSPSGDVELAQVLTAVKGIRYGEVRVIIQDGVIVQIDRVERQRFR
jgi:hypothetical protein